MRWKDVESGIELGVLTSLMRKLDCLSAIHLIANLDRGIRIYASPSCADSVMSHVRAYRHEVGGLLLGQVYQAAAGQNASDAVVIILKSLPSLEFQSSSVSLQMGAEVWSRIKDNDSSHSVVVGWYHSHPNLGAFFSGTDRRTQRGFFNHHYSLGWVIDPVRNDHKLFYTGDADEYPHPLVVLNHDLEMAENF